MSRFACPKCLAVFRNGYPRCPLDGSVLQAITEDPLIGQVIAERYQILELCGEGGMGRVYRARHVRMSKLFALKLLFGDVAADPKARQRFVGEAEAASRLSHPNVISVVDFGETAENLPYLAMDFVEGEELHRVLEREAPLAPVRVISLLRQMLRGLGHAHERGLIHRDFKPENVILTADAGEEIARIVDFGIAVAVEQTRSKERLTTAGTVLGTPAYMSPEQSTDEEMDARSDLFSLGVLLYEMMCGRLPFDGTPLAMAQANLGAPVPFMADRVPGIVVDQRLEAVARRLMSKEPRARFQSAEETLAHIDRLYGRPADTDISELFPDIGERTEVNADQSGAVSALRAMSKREATGGEGETVDAANGEGGAQDSGADNGEGANNGVGGAADAASDGDAAVGGATAASGGPPGDATRIQAVRATPWPGGQETDEIEAQDRRRRPIGWMVAAAAVVLAVGGALWAFGGAEPTEGQRDATLVAAAVRDGAELAEAPTHGAGEQRALATAEDGTLGTAATRGGETAGQGEHVATAPPDAGATDGATEVATDTATDIDQRGVGSATADKEAGRRPATKRQPSTSPAKGGGKRTAQADRAGDTDGKSAADRERASVDDFKRRYRRVGGQLDKLAKSRGDQAAGALRERYFAVAYTDALRNPAVRAEADTALRALERKINQALARK